MDCSFTPICIYTKGLQTLTTLNFQVRGPSAEFQEHVQADAAAEEVAGGGGLDDRHLRLHRQDRRAGTEAQEAHLHRGLHQGRPRAALQQGMQDDIKFIRQLQVGPSACRIAFVDSKIEVTLSCKFIL